jgi:hypothetical protein
LLEVDVQTIFRYSSSFSDFFSSSVHLPNYAIFVLGMPYIYLFLAIMRAFDMQIFTAKLLSEILIFILCAIQASSSNIPFTYYRSIFKIGCQYTPGKKQVSCISYVIPGPKNREN